MLEEIEDIEMDLKVSYTKRRYEYERNTINRISDNPSEFYMYVNKFKCKSKGIGVLYDGK